MRVFLSAGEPSGDHHAALLVRALRAGRPDAECVGLGGPQMAAEGCRLVADMTQLAVMWFLRAILSIHRFVDLARRAERSFLDARPDVCVLVDFPGFHWWLAWRAKRHGIPVVFYCPPQIWAWASWRKKKMRRLVDRVLAPLPFEHEWFVAQGIDSTLVGHPFFDGHRPAGDAAAGSAGTAGRSVAPTLRFPLTSATAPPTFDEDVGFDDRSPLVVPPAGPAATTARRDPPAQPLVLLLPGSRGQEITANLGSLLGAAAIVRGRVPDARFVVAVLHERHADVVRGLIASADRDAVEVVAGRAREFMDEATCAIAVSGSVSLELLAARVPTVIVYRISALAHVVQSWFRHARFITLVNLMAVRDPILPARGSFSPPRGVPPADPEAVYPEYLAVGDPAERAAAHVVEWLADGLARRRVIARLDAIASAVARPGSAARAAAAVLAIAAGADPAAAVRDIDPEAAAAGRAA